MKLYTYFRSSAAYRVRIALSLKGIGYQSIPIHLVKNGGEQHSEAYKALNPAELVPAIEAEGEILRQSIAIIEYLDEVYPEPSLIPGSALERSRIRAFSQDIACDIHPLNNLRVLQYLERNLNCDAASKTAWYHHWLGMGFQALEKTLESSSEGSGFCFGDTPTMADCCLVPQVYNALRFDFDVSGFRNIMRVYERCMEVEAFMNASPESQSDSQ